MTMVSIAEDSKKLREEVKTFQATFENSEFSAEGLMEVCDFLKSIVEEYNTYSISIAHTFLIMPNLLSRQAERHLQSVHNAARHCAATCSPEVLQHLFCPYSTPAAIHKTDIGIQNIDNTLGRSKPRTVN